MRCMHCTVDAFGGFDMVIVALSNLSERYERREMSSSGVRLSMMEVKLKGVSEYFSGLLQLILLHIPTLLLTRISL